MMSAEEVLKTFWGYNSFRDGQKEIIDSVSSGKDTIALLPTGGGKSVCFQVPALMNDGVAVVISPLIALMKDQVENLKRVGVSAICIHSGLSFQEIDTALDNAIYGDVKFLYVSPERLQTDLFKYRVQKMRVNLLVIDEAHCISQWGYDFRPSYLQISQIRQLLPQSTPVIAVTATATPQVVEDIKEKLQLRNPAIFSTGFGRKNITYVVRECSDKWGNLLRVCNGVKGSGIVYARERKKCVELCDFLNENGVPALFYHAGLEKRERTLRQEAWMKGEKRVMVATNAFGMGIDKSDVRFVLHYEIPDSIEAYFQESGRAGRDGIESYAVLLWNSSDLKRLRTIHSIMFPPLEYISDIYQKVFNYLNVAYEEGKGRAFKFQLNDFAAHFKLNAPMAYYAIKYIEQEGYWELTDIVESPAKVMFCVNRDELYSIQLKDQSLDILIKAMLRMYTGIFSNLTSIDIEALCRITSDSSEGLIEKLKNLSTKGIIIYKSSFKMPLLITNYERLVEKNLYLPESRYLERKSSYEKRIESMIGYVTNTEMCRNRLLVGYFGQSASADCGKCDTCLKKKRKDAKYCSIEAAQIEREIICKIKEAGGTITITQLKTSTIGSYDLFPEVLEQMLDKGFLKLNGNRFILND